MNILFIAGWFPQGDSYKGVFIKEHALAVARKHRVAVIYGEENNRQNEKFRFSFSTEDGLEILRYTYRDIPFFSSFPRYVRGTLTAFEKFRERGFTPDVVHACVYHTGVPANIIKQRYRIPYVLREGYSGFMRKSLRKSKLKKARIGIENADCVLPISDAQRRAIIACGIKGKFEVVPNTVPDIFYYAPEFKNRETVKKIICVAAMHPKKNYPMLIKACEILYRSRTDFRVNIIGEGEKLKEYRETVGRASLENVIVFLGGRKKKEIARMMQSSDFSVLPSMFEPFGNVLIESLACGLPVVATRVGGIPEIIDEGNGILVESDNPREFSAAMNRMLDNPDMFDRENIALRAHEKYSYDKIGEQLDGIYKRVLESYK